MAHPFDERGEAAAAGAVEPAEAGATEIKRAATENPTGRIRTPPLLGERGARTGQRRNLV